MVRKMGRNLKERKVGLGEIGERENRWEKIEERWGDMWETMEGEGEKGGRR